MLRPLQPAFGVLKLATDAAVLALAWVISGYLGVPLPGGIGAGILLGWLLALWSVGGYESLRARSACGRLRPYRLDAPTLGTAALAARRQLLLAFRSSVRVTCNPCVYHERVYVLCV